jgi:hypothetical protein
VWGCPDPTIVVPLDHEPRDTVLRVFARVVGQGEVVALESDPPGRRVTTDAPGAGVGIEPPRGASAVRIQLRVDGPAALDVYELHGSVAPRAAPEHVR